MEFTITIRADIKSGKLEVDFDQTRPMLATQILTKATDLVRQVGINREVQAAPGIVLARGGLPPPGPNGR